MPSPKNPDKYKSAVIIFTGRHQFWQARNVWEHEKVSHKCVRRRVIKCYGLVWRNIEWTKIVFKTSLWYPIIRSEKDVLWTCLKVYFCTRNVCHKNTLSPTRRHTERHIGTHRESKIWKCWHCWHASVMAWRNINLNVGRL